MHELAKRLEIDCAAIIKLEIPDHKETVPEQTNRGKQDFSIISAHRLSKSELKSLFEAISSSVREDLDRNLISEWDAPQQQPPLALPFKGKNGEQQLFCLPLQAEDPHLLGDSGASVSCPPHFLLVGHSRKLYDTETPIRYYQIGRAHV